MRVLGMPQMISYGSLGDIGPDVLAVPSFANADCCPYPLLAPLNKPDITTPVKDGYFP
jgi:hypothetical protein